MHKCKNKDGVEQRRSCDLWWQVFYRYRMSKMLNEKGAEFRSVHLNFLRNRLESRNEVVDLTILWPILAFWIRFNTFPSFCEKCDKISWCQENKVKLEYIEYVLFNLTWFEYLIFSCSPFFDAVDKLSWVYPPDVIIFRGKQKTLSCQKL